MRQRATRSHSPWEPRSHRRQPPTPSRFIKWTQEAFSAGGHKAELLPLLERCTRELQAGGRYADDVRYLRVWVQYVSRVPGRAQESMLGGQL